MRAIAAALAYTAFWLATRAPAIAANPLFFDDFAVPLRPGLFYLGSYRPLVWLEYRIFEAIVPNHFWTVLPKLSAAVYFGVSAMLLAMLLRRWNVKPSLAYTLPLVVLANPVLNDAGLWNSLHALPLAMAFLTAGVLLWEERRFTAGTVLIFIGLNGYQAFVALVLVYLVAEPFVKRLADTPWKLRDSLLKLALTAVAGAMQIAVMQLIRPWITGADERGLVTFSSTFLAEKYHGIFNLAVNGVMPSIAYYTSALQAMSLWKFVPLSIGLVTAAAFLIRRRTAFDIAMALIFPLLMFFVPALPTLIMSQSPEAWRVATPTAFALALSVLPLLLQLPRFGPVIAILATMVMLPPTFFETRERVKSWTRDEATIRAITTHWQNRPITVAYVGPKYGNIEEHRLIESHDLTWGYRRFTPAVWSPFNNGWFAQHYIATYHGLGFMGCGERRNPICTAARSACSRPRSDGQAIWPRIVHSQTPGLTAVCMH